MKPQEQLRRMADLAELAVKSYGVASGAAEAMRAGADALDALERLEKSVKIEPMMLHHGWPSACWPTHPRGLSTVQGIAAMVKNWPLDEEKGGAA